LFFDIHSLSVLAVAFRQRAGWNASCELRVTSSGGFC
jgi:hypothetical protein